MDIRFVLALLAVILVMGAIGLLGVWYFTRPNDGPVDLAAPSAADGRMFSLSATFPPRDGTPLLNPRGIDGFGERIFVADPDGKNVVVYRRDGARQGAITLSEVRGAPYPVDVAALSDRNVAVLDGTTRSVSIYTLDGRLRISDSLELRLPKGSTVTAITSSAGKLCVADSGRKRFYFYGADGALERQVQMQSQPPVGFVGDAALDTEAFYITDATGGRFIRRPIDAAQPSLVFEVPLSLPRGTAVEPRRGWAFVADVLAGSVHVLGRDGALLDTASREGSGIDLSRPEHLWWDSRTGRLYVTDASEGRIVVLNVQEASR